MSTAGAVELRAIESLDEFERHAPAWDALVASMPRPSPFMLSAWLEPWWSHFGRDRSMRVEAAFLDGELVGGLPLELERRRGVIVGRFMGREHAALGDVLAREDVADEVVAGIVGRLGVVGADYLDLFGLAREGRLFGAIEESEVLVERVQAPVLDVRGGWDAVYGAKTSSRRRNLHRRRRRQLHELGEIELISIAGERELAASLTDLFRLHDLRWAGRPDRSDFTTNRGLPFNVDAMSRFARAGVARVLLMKLDGRAIAFQYYLVFERRMFFYRLAFDPDFARWSPGLLTTLAAIEVAAAEGVERVEFLGGDERYKQELADSNDPLYECIGFASSWRGRAEAIVAGRVLDARLRFKRSDLVRRIDNRTVAVRRVRRSTPDRP
jgi:CelD/BcsL family acetyltransferase involved in cellulose biosynthesis